jgi:putative acetyltransferase
MRKYQIQDKDSIIQMIDTIYQEYGDAIYLENADSDLLNIEKNYLLNGDFWVETDKEENNQVIGIIAVKRDAANEQTAFLKRFYLMSKYRGSGLAKKMHDTAIEWCKENQITKIHLWSDTRFTRAHIFYQKNGYEQQGLRDMNDGAMPYQEYYFVKFIR